MKRLSVLFAGDVLACGLFHDCLVRINRAIADTGALQYTIDQAHSQAAEAKQSIADLDDSEFKQALLFLADYAVERNH